jgi:hypothetical protein
VPLSLPAPAGKRVAPLVVTTPSAMTWGKRTSRSMRFRKTGSRSEVPWRCSSIREFPVELWFDRPQAHMSAVFKLFARCDGKTTPARSASAVQCRGWQVARPVRIGEGLQRESLETPMA